jgi:outer membrane protein OmpA-like peptidoglycan-associated protein
MKPHKTLAGLVVLSAMLAGAAYGADMTFNSVLYPDGVKTPVVFETTDRAPKAALEGSVKPEQGQTWIEVEWKKLEPALLFGGDVNCWVLWTITPDGTAQSQGELPVRDDRSGSTRLSVPYKQFAMMVTAEPFPIVRRPSSLVVFVSAPTSSKMAKNETVAYNGFRETKHDVESIAELKYKDETPVELQQARRAVELMDRFEAEKYAQTAARDARTALSQAEDAYAGRVGKKKDVPELASRTMTATNTAVTTAFKAVEAQKVKDAEAQRLAELSRKEAEIAQKAAETEAERAARMQTEAALAEVERQKAALAREKATIQAERDALAARLSTALGTVSATERTGRGLVVSLSGGILFETGKSALKTDAKVALAKLSGILLMIPNENIQIEGYTDSTGSEETNNKLSAARAESVREFLRAQGVPESRMGAKGLGATMPVASNDTADGRSKNRRVEIVVPEMTASR